jgi:hypothetical protein
MYELANLSPIIVAKHSSSFYLLSINMHLPTIAILSLVLTLAVTALSISTESRYSNARDLPACAVCHLKSALITHIQYVIILLSIYQS